MWTWLKRSAGMSPCTSIIASSGPRMYAKPAPPCGFTLFFFASSICALVNPSTPPVPGHVSLLMLTVPPSSVAYNGRRRSEAHTPEPQSRLDLVCRLLLEEKHVDIADVNTHARSPAPLVRDV